MYYPRYCQNGKYNIFEQICSEKCMYMLIWACFQCVYIASVQESALGVCIKSGPDYQTAFMVVLQCSLYPIQHLIIFPLVGSIFFATVQITCNKYALVAKDLLAHGYTRTPKSHEGSCSRNTEG